MYFFKTHRKINEISLLNKITEDSVGNPQAVQAKMGPEQG